VVTAHHVVCKDNDPPDVQPKVTVLWVPTGEDFLFSASAPVVLSDWRTDLALLRLEHPEELPVPLSAASLTVLSSTPAVLGDYVSFEAFERTSRNRYGFRSVRAQVKRAIAIAPGGLEQRVLMLDATAWPGASGGPVFSQAGQVVGIISAIHRKTRETLIRDARWVLDMWDAPHGFRFSDAIRLMRNYGDQLRPAGNDRPQLVGWPQRLRNFAQRLL